MYFVFTCVQMVRYLLIFLFTLIFSCFVEWYMVCPPSFYSEVSEVVVEADVGDMDMEEVREEVGDEINPDEDPLIQLSISNQVCIS